MTRNAHSVKWMAGTAAVCLTALVTAWLLLLGPMLDAAAATRAQAVQVRDQNTVLAGRLDALAAEFEGIEAYRAELTTLRQQLPDDADLSELNREIDFAADHAGVSLVGIEVVDSIDMTGAASGATAAPAPVDPNVPGSDDPSSEAAAQGAIAGAPLTAPPVEGMVAIPLTTTVAGSVDAVRAFLGQLQTGMQRQVLVTALSVSALEESAGEDGRRVAAAGDIEAVVSAFAYVLGSDAGVTADADGALPSTAGRSPFQPSGSSSDAVTGLDALPDSATEAADAVAGAIEARLSAATAAAKAEAEAQAAVAAAAVAAAAAAAPPTTSVTTRDTMDPEPDEIDVTDVVGTDG